MLARPNEYQAVARIKVHRDVQFSGPSDPVFSDPYFIQTEFEVIQSEVVLGKVVEKLDLAREWAKKGAAGGRLKPVEAIGLLKRRLDFRPMRNTELLEIRVGSDDPVEVAKIANTLAETFRDYRMRQQNQLMKSERENANWRIVTYQVEIVDSAIAPALPIRPNRPLAAAVFLFGSLLTIFGIYLAIQVETEQINFDQPSLVTPPL